MARKPANKPKASRPTKPAKKDIAPEDDVQDNLRVELERASEDRGAIYLESEASFEKFSDTVLETAPALTLEDTPVEHVPTIPQPPSVEAAVPNSLTITSATYGRADKVVDVAEVLRGHIIDGRVNVQVTTDVLCGGTDPCLGVGKQLVVQYLLNGQEHSAIVQEGNLFAIGQ